MKLFVIIVSILFSQSLFGQFFVNTGALVGISKGAIVTVQNMDAENHGDISHAGDLEIAGNIVNYGLWVCDPANISRIALTLDWSNNSVFNAGIGRIEFKGTNQRIGGAFPTNFYNLILNGVSGNTKTMGNDIACLDTLYLNNVELATTTNIFSLRNALIPVQRGTGYISTFNPGSVKVIYPFAMVGNTEVPLGYGIGATKYKPVFLINTAKDSFSFTLIGHSPTMDGRTPAGSLQDSLCSINLDYYYRLQTFGSKLFYGITKSSTEQDYTKIGRWSGTGWDKISASGYSTALPVQNLAFNSQASLLNEYVSQAQETPFVDAGPDFYLTQNASAQLTTNGYFPNSSTFYWNPNDDLDCGNCKSPVFTMGNPGTYFITVSNGNSCFATDSFHIFRTLPDVYIPNTFTPNGDFLNEGFGPILSGRDKILKLRIYNRWGEKLYEGTQNWDGTYKGKPTDQGIYTYIISIERYDGKELNKKVVSGTITLLR